MKYALVATVGYLLLVDLESKEVLPLENHRPEYYGISWFAGESELVLSHSGVDNAKLTDVASYAQSEQGWLSKGPVESRRFLAMPHQILCAPDGRVVSANTGRNVVSVVDLNRPNIFQEAGVTSNRWDRLELNHITGDHLNSVFLRGNELFVIAHGHSKGSKLAVFSYPELELVSVTSLGARTGLHNIWITSEGQRISCHSEVGSLIDIDSAEPLWESGAAVYTRGLAATADHVVVGESQKTGRDLRRASLSALWILDRKNWRAIDYLCLGEYGAVNEVRVIDVPDDAHHGIPLGGYHQLLHQRTPRAMVNAIARDRLDAARAVFASKAIWQSYRLVLGSPETFKDGSKRAVNDNLCLMLQRPVESASAATQQFAYALDGGPSSHVSAVLGYAGHGGDTHMVAVLLHGVGSHQAAMSVWRHDGSEWQQLPQITVPDLPMAGELHVHSTAAQATVLVGGREVLRLDASTIGLERCDAGVGIRWMGATVKPLN